MPDRYGNVVVPVLVDIDGRARHEGSALLVEGPDNTPWLVSAAHVLAQPEGLTLGVPWSRDAMLHILGTVYSTCPLAVREAQQDKIDAAVVKLDSSIATNLRDSGARFLPFKHLEHSASAADCQCALTGYPDGSVEWNDRFVLTKVELTRVHVTLYPNEQVKLRGFDPKRHVISKYANKLSDGSQQKFPKPQGMSGGVVWILAGDETRAAGIITTYISRGTYKRALVCTRMAGIARIIQDPASAHIIKKS